MAAYLVIPKDLREDKSRLTYKLNLAIVLDMVESY